MIQLVPHAGIALDAPAVADVVDANPARDRLLAATGAHGDVKGGVSLEPAHQPVDRGRAVETQDVGDVLQRRGIRRHGNHGGYGHLEGLVGHFNLFNT